MECSGSNTSADESEDYSVSSTTSADESEDYSVSSTEEPNSKATSSTNGFRVRGSLKMYRLATYTVRALYDQIHNHDINLRPDYQRGVVWPEAKQVGIIDSIFRNFFIPPVIFAVTTLDDGSEARRCIDGKQRLTSIYRFMSGLIPHKDTCTGERLWYTALSPGSPEKKVLQDAQRRLFANKQIGCVEYYDIKEEDEREIFQRVQLGVPLKSGEKLQATASPTSQFIHELRASYVQAQGGGLNTLPLLWDKTRGVDFRCIAQSIYTIKNYSTVSSPNIGTIKKWLSGKEELTKKLQQEIRLVFDIFVQIIYVEKTTKVAFKLENKVSPVEFIHIVVLIAVWKHKLNLAELREVIGRMREDVRRCHSDIRLNAKVMKTMLNFIRTFQASSVSPELSAEAVIMKPPLLASTEKRKRWTDQGDSTDCSNSSNSDGRLTKKVKRSAAL